jgi:hypothetical protein
MNSPGPKDRQSNRLAESTSPYLLQHADNPVDWYPWGREALDRAKREDKPIFLSIGYASCHWCHVMERESFEDEEIARLMNENFVCIKVDREERPDVDELYMNAVQMMTGSGGWPLSVFLVPDGTPYLGGTYFPPEDGPGRPGFPSVLRHAARLYRERRDDVARVGKELSRRLAAVAEGPDAAAEVDLDLIGEAVYRYHDTFDPQWGGFGTAPKFPPSGALALMLRHHRRTGDKAALDMLTTTLDKMAAGGIFDQLGGGFHRYSVDRHWLVPHFEKMLYDNALLAAVYLDAFRLTETPLYRRIAHETLDYVLRVMQDDAGGFHSAQDADTDGREGATYLWTPDEIEAVLGREDAATFNRYYGVTGDGKFEGRSILHVADPDEAAARELAPLRAKLLAERDRRPQPRKDDKVLASWNALVISALARGHQVFGDDRYRDAAERAARFVLTAMRTDGHLLHTWRAATAHVPAFLDDYAFLLAATVDLYETTFDPKWLEHARSLAADMTEALWDPKSGGFYKTRSDQADLLVRSRDAYDGALPAGNAVAALALLRLGRLTDDNDLFARGERTLRAFLGPAKRAPQAFARLLCAADFHAAPRREIVVAGDPDSDATQDLLRAVRQRYLPNVVVALARPEVEDPLPLLEGRTPVDGRPAAYVCENNVCRAPVTSASSVIQALESPEPERKE